MYTPQSAGPCQLYWTSSIASRTDHRARVCRVSWVVTMVTREQFYSQLSRRRGTGPETPCRGLGQVTLE